MTVGTVLSRITGLIRLAAIAAALGIVESGRLTDTYNIGNTAPNILYELALGGVLTSVFVPLFVELLEREGRERAWEVASALINLSLVLLTAIAILGILAAPLIADFYASRLDGADAQRQQEILTFLLRLFIPQIVFYGLAALTAGLLNAHKRFGAPMYTPVLNNLAVIIVFVVFHQTYSRVSFDTIGTSELLLIGAGTTAGVALMAFAQLPFLRGLGRYRFTLSPHHPALRKLLRLSVFVVGYVVVNQLGYLIVQYLANEQTGGYSAYVSAFTFFMLPHGLFAVSVMTALLPGISEHAVHKRWDEFRERLSTGIRATLLLVLPAAIGYLVLGEAAVRFLLERGIMTAESTELVAGVLRVFVIGLVPFSLFQLFLRAFYALQDTRTPFVINCVAMAVNIAVNIPLFEVWGVQGLAAGHAVGYIVGLTLQGHVLSKRIGGLGAREIAASGVRIVVAGAAMGGVVWVVFAGVEALVGSEATVAQLVTLGSSVTAGVVCYLAFAWLLKVRELAHVRALLSRRT